MTQAGIDVVVVGSGFGGSVTANRLALAGKRVLVLERGPWRDSVPVRSMGIARRSPFPYGGKAVTHLVRSLNLGRLSLRLNPAGMYEIGVFPGLYTLSASAVGGGSTAYGGLLVPPLNASIWSGHHPELDPADVERYYDRVIGDLGGARLTREHALPQSVWTHFPEGAGRRCRPADPQPHMGVLLPRSPEQAGAAATGGAANVERRYCSFDGDSFLGSRGGAKASVDFVYLAPVLGKGVTVRDLCEVTAISPSGPGGDPGYVVQFRDLGTGTHQYVCARRVVIAAGTLNTMRLLFAGARQPGGLAPMPALGRRFFANGDLAAAWLRRTAPVSSFRSTPSQGEFTVEGHESQSFGFGGLPGIETLPLPGFIKRRLETLFFMYAMGADSGAASASYAGGRLHLDYDYRKEPVYHDLREALRVVSLESGSRVIPVRKPLSPHVSGGACVGATAMDGVVDHRGEVHGNPGLYVADAAALPAAPGGPPSVAIAAWAHHVANAIAQAS